MTAMNMIEALNSAHDVMMDRDDNIVAFGEDVGFFGGVFRATEGLQKKFGRHRVFDTPISEVASSRRNRHGPYGLGPSPRSSSPTTFPGFDRSSARRPRSATAQPATGACR
jgi:2-oxoisovalerate dehydrogenase E1 component beta subunit